MRLRLSLVWMVLPGRGVSYWQDLGRRTETQGAQPFREGLAAVSSGRKWNYIDKQGKIAIDGAFDQANPFSEGLALVFVSGAGAGYRYIDKHGKIAIETPFHFARRGRTVQRGTGGGCKRREVGLYRQARQTGDPDAVFLRATV